MSDNIQEEIEDNVINWITSGTGGRLIVFKPEKDRFGADLVAERRGKYKEKSLSFKVNSFIIPAGVKTLTKDFLEDDFKSDKNFYLVFVCFDEVSQKIKDFIWLIPSLQFRDIAEAGKSSSGKNILRFESSLDVKAKNKYSKFLVDTKELGKLILDAFKAEGKINFEETGFQDKEFVNLDRLKEFLCQARKDVYASNANPVDNPRLLESRQLEFQKADYFYRNICFVGSKKIIGQEIVYQNSKPVWAMNYFGTALGLKETNFLKESLLKLSEKCRLGQNCEHEKRELKYQDQGQGSLDDFSGKEEVFLEGKNIYKLNYQGGLISDKL